MKLITSVWLFVLVLAGYSEAQTNDFENSTTADSIVFNIIEDINADSVEYFISKLQSYESRFLGNPNRFEIADWMKGEFERFGFTDVKLDTFTCINNYGTTQQVNVVATLSGTGEPDKLHIIGGHYDSYNTEENPEIWAPGADDNASGTAAVLEAARVVMLNNYQPASTIQFIAFAAEEYMLSGNSGSEYYAEQLKNSGADLELMINCDMILFNYDALTDYVEIIYYPDHERLLGFTTDKIRKYTSLTPYTGESNQWSDSRSFTEVGYPAIYFAEGTLSSYYHKSGDTLNAPYYDINYCSGIIKGAVATLIYHLNIPEVPENFKLRNSGDGSSVSASWTDKSNFAGNRYILITDTDTLTTTDTTIVISGLTDSQLLNVSLQAVSQTGFVGFPTSAEIRVASTPFAVTGLVDQPGTDSITLMWSPNTEMDLTGYNIYRSEERYGSYEKITPVPVTDTLYSDIADKNTKMKYYFVTALDSTSIESLHPDTIRSAYITLNQGILLVDYTGQSSTDSLTDAFYSNILSGTSFATLEPENLIGKSPKLADFGHYSTVIIHSDYVLDRSRFDFTDDLRQYLNYGGNFFYSGYSPAYRFAGATAAIDSFNPGSFIYDQLKIAGRTYHSQSRFYQAVPNSGEYSSLTVDGEYITIISSIEPAPEGNAPFSYLSNEDPSSVYADMNGLPVAVSYTGTDYKTFILSFPLSKMVKTDAERLIEYVLSEQFGETVGVYEETDCSNLIPDRYTLSQNYPNPFNPSTEISYTLPEKSRVTLIVFNILGQKVKQLVNELQPAGRYSVRWDADGLASGVYLYTLEIISGKSSEKNRITKKMILMK